MFFDPMWFLFAVPPLLLMLYAQIKVSRTYNKYSKVLNAQGVTGAQVARTLLGNGGLGHIGIEQTPGELTDHYDPKEKMLRLSPGVYKNASVASMGIVAHEVGHAMQDHTGYLPMRVRGGLVPLANLGTTMGYIFFLIGFFLQFTPLVWVGIALFSAAVLFALVTLPVELDASHRARLMLQANGLVSMEEYNAASAVLNAAALTYLAAVLQAVSNLLYFVFAALGMRNRD